MSSDTEAAADVSDTTGTPAPKRKPNSTNSATTTAAYDAKAIQVLEGLDPVRKRPGMYIGSTGLQGLHHLIWEVVDNSVDEAMAGHCTRIGVTLLADGGCQVEDNGRGIPIDPFTSGEHKGKSAAEVVLTVLHAGGKFGGDGYKVSGGLHGVGVSVVNALSERLVIEVDRNGKRHRQEYAKGGKPQGKMTVVGDTPKRGRVTGTSITFWPDPTIFAAEGTEFVARTVLERLQTMAFLNKGLEIVFTDQREGREQTITYLYKGGILDFVKHLNATKEPLFSKVCQFEDEDEADGQMLDIAMQWNTGYYEGIHGYANGISTIEGGMHVEGFKTALTSVVNKYARAKNLLKEKDPNLTGEDIREGITAIISVKLREPQFEGQTKAKLGNVPMRSFVQKATNERMAEWLEENPTEANKVVKKGLAAAQARVAAKNARNAIRRKTALSGAGMPDKLKDCSSKNADESELFIVEGDSAGGTAVDARDPRTQAILPIRGKILNVEQRPDRQDAEEQRDPGTDHGHRWRCRRRVRRRQGSISQGDLSRGCRCRRQPHPHPAAHVLLPPDPRDGRSGLRLHRPATAVLHRGRQGEGVPQGRPQEGGVPRRAAQPQEAVQPFEGSRRDGLGGAAYHHDARWDSHAVAGDPRPGSTGRRDHLDADGRRRSGS